MHILTGGSAVNPLLEELAAAGHLRRRPAADGVAGGGWEPSAAVAAQGFIRHRGRLFYWTDVSGMLPLYQEMYREIFAERLAFWGLGGEDVALLAGGGLILFGGPEPIMRAKRPAAVAAERVQAGDESWVERLEHSWQRAAAEFEDQVEDFWSGLLEGHAGEEAWRAVVGCKVRLGAIGVDALMPPAGLAESWLAPHLRPDLVAEVAEALYLPASGYLAYDLLETECWRIAASTQSLGVTPEEARARFIRDGLFFTFDALNVERKDYFFREYPLLIAARYRRAAGTLREMHARMDDVRRRDRRRRLHREWALQQLASVGDAAHARRLALLHRLLGTARDFDEEKRRLNMKFWRALFALADGLQISLARPPAGVEQLAQLIRRRDGRVSIDPILAAKSDGPPASD